MKTVTMTMITRINDNQNIIFTRVDKGNTTVALNISDYKQKMDTLLRDTDTYELIKHNPCKKK